MSRAPSDVLAVLFLAREAGLFVWPGADRPAVSRLDVVPLFETIAELQQPAARSWPGCWPARPTAPRLRRAATASR